MFDSGFGGLTVARALIDLLPARGPRLRRRHRPLPVRAPAARRGAGLRPPDHPLLVDEHDVKLVIVACNTAAAAGVGRAAGRASTCPSSASSSPACGALVRATHERPGRRDRHGRHHRRPVPTSGRWPSSRRAGWSSPARPARASSSSWSGARPAATRCTCSPSGCWPRARRQGRHPAARLHPLPVPGPHHQRRDGPRRGARVLGRRDGVRGAARSSRRTDVARPASARRRGATASCRRATSSGSASSAGACSARSSTRPSHITWAVTGSTSDRRAGRTPVTAVAARMRGMTTRAPTAASPTSSARSPSSGTSPTCPPARCLVTFGRTRVLCTASIDEDVPALDAGQGQGLGHRRVLDAPRRRRPSGSAAR